MDTKQLDQIDVLSKSLTIIESMVLKPHAVSYNDIIREKLILLRSKMVENQCRLKFLSDSVNIANQWAVKQKDLLQDLSRLQQRLEHLENNLPSNCFMEIADLDENDELMNGSQESVQSINSNGGGSQPVVLESKSVMTNGSRNTKEEEYPCIKHLTSAEWEKVPSYLRGRMKLEVMTPFISSFNAVLRKKYALLKLPKKQVPRTDLPLYLKWKSLDNREAKGHAFITDKDLCTHGDGKLSKQDFTLLQILRHCKRLKESKFNKECYYLLLN